MISTPAEHLPPSCARMPAGRWRLLLLLALAPLLSGCLVIEKKTLVLVIPPDSREVRMYYVFEGLSVLEEAGNVDEAKRQLDDLKKPGFGFFAMGGGNSNDPALKDFRFDDMRLFVDPTRKRQLCADRRAILLDRDRFADVVNEALGEVIQKVLPDSTEAFQEKVRDFNKDLAKEDTVRTADGLGMGALLKVVRGMAQMALKFDTPSLERIRAASRRKFHWLRFEKETVRLVLPVTPECAQKILADRDIVAWVKEMQKLVEPLSVAARPEGLVLVLGKSPIRLTYTDPRKHKDDLEQSLFEQVGSPEPVFLRGKKATAEDLIKEFIAEAKKKS